MYGYQWYFAVAVYGISGQNMDMTAWVIVLLFSSQSALRNMWVGASADPIIYHPGCFVQLLLIGIRCLFAFMFVQRLIEVYDSEDMVRITYSSYLSLAWQISLCANPQSTVSCTSSWKCCFSNRVHRKEVSNSSSVSTHNWFLLLCVRMILLKMR